MHNRSCKLMKDYTPNFHMVIQQPLCYSYKVQCYFKANNLILILTFTIPKVLHFRLMSLSLCPFLTTTSALRLPLYFCFMSLYFSTTCFQRISITRMHRSLPLTYQLKVYLQQMSKHVNKTSYT